MRLRSFALSAVFFLVPATFAIPAGASPITYLIHFTASNAFPHIPPDPVVGSFTVTFDPQVAYLNLQTSGLVVNSLNLAFFPGIKSGFEYFPDHNGGELVISGTTFPAGVLAGTPGFLFIALNLQTPHPTLYNFFDWSNTGFPAVIELDHVSGTITPVPEGNTLLLLATGVFGAACFEHRARRISGGWPRSESHHQDGWPTSRF